MSSSMISCLFSCRKQSLFSLDSLRILHAKENCSARAAADFVSTTISSATKVMAGVRAK